MDRIKFYKRLWTYYLQRIAILLSSKEAVKDWKIDGGMRCMFYRPFASQRSGSCYGRYSAFIKGEYRLFGFWTTGLYWKQKTCNKCGDMVLENFYLCSKEEVDAFYGIGDGLPPLSLETRIALERNSEKNRRMTKDMMIDPKKAKIKFLPKHWQRIRQ